jgi:diguanylate cyclase (GGDEF)-like protein/PAS domain S-box-containing protein
VVDVVALPDAYLAVVDGLPDAALLFRAGELVHLNAEARSRLQAAGLLPDDVALGSVDVTAAVVPEDAPVLRQAMREAVDGRAVPSTRLTIAGGTIVVACVFNPIDLDGESYVQVLARDVTSRARAEQALRSSEAQFRAIFDESPVGVALAEGDRFTLVNSALCQMLGRSPDQLLGLTASDITLPDDRHLEADVLRELEGGRVARAQMRYLRADGTVLWGELTAVRVSGEDGGPRRTLVHLRDITVERQAAEHLQHLALHDTMTGLGNRALLQDRLDHALAARPEQRRGIAVLFVDLDAFKAVNDGLGHAVGDRVLQATARRLRAVVRPADTVTRWGGDEFVVLMEGLDSADEAVVVARRIEQAVAAPLEHRSDELLVTASVGIAYASHADPTTSAKLLHEADAAMYRAKRSGRARHTVFDAALRDAASRRSHVESLLRRAVHSDRVVLHYQPILRLSDRAVVGAEALLRLRDDDGSLLYPEAFLDIAEDTGLMLPIEHVVLLRACEQAAAWLDAGHDLGISVNVCAKQIAMIEDFEAEVLKALSVTGLPGTRLTCEVTEYAVLDTSERTVEGICRLKDHGVEFSVDDFGTGYASMTYLQTLPVGEVKIDRRFVARAAQDKPAAAIVRAVAGIASELEMRSVAEGIEDESVHELVVRLGVGHGQGYLYGRPVPAEDFPLPAGTGT